MRSPFAGLDLCDRCGIAAGRGCIARSPSGKSARAKPSACWGRPAIPGADAPPLRPGEKRRPSITTTNTTTPKGT